MPLESLQSSLLLLILVLNCFDEAGGENIQGNEELKTLLDVSLIVNVKKLSSLKVTK